MSLNRSGGPEPVRGRAGSTPRFTLIDGGDCACPECLDTKFITVACPTCEEAKELDFMVAWAKEWDEGA